MRTNHPIVYHVRTNYALIWIVQYVIVTLIINVNAVVWECVCVDVVCCVCFSVVVLGGASPLYPRDDTHSQTCRLPVIICNFSFDDPWSLMDWWWRKAQCVCCGDYDLAVLVLWCSRVGVFVYMMINPKYAAPVIFIGLVPVVMRAYNVIKAWIYTVVCVVNVGLLWLSALRWSFVTHVNDVLCLQTTRPPLCAKYGKRRGFTGQLDDVQAPRGCWFVCDTTACVSINH